MSMRCARKREVDGNNFGGRASLPAMNLTGEEAAAGEIGCDLAGGGGGFGRGDSVQKRAGVLGIYRGFFVAKGSR